MNSHRRADAGEPPSDPARPPLVASPADDPAEESVREAAQKALLERPSVSIRARITLAFLLFLVLSAGSALTSWWLVSQAQRKLQLLVVVDRLTIEVQQARRFEKNYLLYGTNLADALEHARQASELLAAHLQTGERDVALTDSNLAILARDLDRYEELLTALAEGDRARADASRAALVASVREHGTGTTSMVLEMASSERRSVEDMLAAAKRVPLFLLGVTLFLTVYVAAFLARQILGPLTRLLGATQRIAAGDFRPILPARRYRDEFSNLSVAINRMIHELERRYQIVVESHKLRAVGTLTAGIAHELNNPLNNITLTATTLRQFHAKLDDDERVEMLDDLVKEADRSQTIVRNLLDFTRQTEAKVEALDVGRLAEDVVALAQNQIRLRGCAVEVEIPPNLPVVHGDRNLLSQVFLNLLLNALDALDKGGTVRVGASREPGFVAAHVTDNGCGIPPHVLPSIFDPFFSTKSTGQGTGLGLSMSRNIVRRHGGDIRVRSEPGEGSTFTVLLPTTMVGAELSAVRDRPGDP